VKKFPMGISAKPKFRAGDVLVCKSLWQDMKGYWTINWSKHVLKVGDIVLVDDIEDEKLMSYNSINVQFKEPNNEFDIHSYYLNQNNFVKIGTL